MNGRHPLWGATEPGLQVTAELFLLTHAELSSSLLPRRCYSVARLTRALQPTFLR